MGFSDFDRSSKPVVAHDDLEQAKFLKTPENKVAVRVGNEPDSPVFVSLTYAYGSDMISIYDSESSVAQATEELILRFTIPPAKIFKIQQISVSGEAIARYTVKINGAINKVKRTHYSSGLNTEFKYSLLRLHAGNVIEIYAYNASDRGSSDFNATIEGIQENE